MLSCTCGANIIINSLNKAISFKNQEVEFNLLVHNALTWESVQLSSMFGDTGTAALL